MTEHVPPQEAEGHLAVLVERARSGEDIVLTDGGRPVVRLVVEGAKAPEKLSDRLIARRRPRPLPFGISRGQIRIADGVDAPLPDDLLKAFYGPLRDEPWPDDSPSVNK